MKRFFLLGLAGMLILACSPKVVSHLSADYPALDPDAEVLVLEENTPQSLAAGIDFNVISGTLTHYTLTMNGKDQRIDLDKDEYMGLGHLALSAGLRYYF